MAGWLFLWLYISIGCTGGVLEKKVWMDWMEESFLAVVESLEVTILLHTLASAAFGWSSSNSRETRMERLLLLAVVGRANRCITVLARPFVLGRVSSPYDHYLPRLEKSTERAVAFVSL